MLLRAQVNSSLGVFLAREDVDKTTEDEVCSSLCVSKKR